MLVSDDHLPISGAIMERVFLRRSTPIAIALPALRPFSTRAAYSNRWVVTTWVISKTINFKVSEEKDVFIVLFKDNLKEERIQMLIFAFILNVVYVEREHLLDGIEG